MHAFLLQRTYTRALAFLSPLPSLSPSLIMRERTHAHDHSRCRPSLAWTSAICCTACLHDRAVRVPPINHILWTHLAACCWASTAPEPQCAPLPPRVRTASHIHTTRAHTTHLYIHAYIDAPAPSCLPCGSCACAHNGTPGAHVPAHLSELSLCRLQPGTHLISWHGICMPAAHLMPTYYSLHHTAPHAQSRVSYTL